MQSFYCTKEWSYDHLGNGLKALDWKRALNRIFIFICFIVLQKKVLKKVLQKNNKKSKASLLAKTFSIGQ